MRKNIPRREESAHVSKRIGHGPIGRNAMTPHRTAATHYYRSPRKGTR